MNAVKVTNPFLKWVTVVLDMTAFIILTVDIAIRLVRTKSTMDGITADKMIVFDTINVILLLSSVILQIATWRETRRFCREWIYGLLHDCIIHTSK